MKTHYIGRVGDRRDFRRLQRNMAQKAILGGSYARTMSDITRIVYATADQRHIGSRVQVACSCTRSHPECSTSGVALGHDVWKPVGDQ
jgi:hypothetical protein